MGRSECCYRTALSVHHKGKRLDDFFEIGSVEGLADGDTVEVVEGEWRGGVGGDWSLEGGRRGRVVIGRECMMR